MLKKIALLGFDGFPNQQAENGGNIFAFLELA